MLRCAIFVAFAIFGRLVSGQQCPPDGIAYLPHATLCNSYYFCTTGAPNLRVCPNNMHWDNDRRFCRHPDSFQCNLRDLRCPEVTDPMDFVFLPNELDCTRFAFCMNGVAFQQSCVDGLYWNPEIRACSAPESSSCVSTTTEPPLTTPVEVTCPSDVGLFNIPHPSRCEYYFVCSDGMLHFRSCAPGLYFDAVNEWCDLKENVVCAQDHTTLPPTTTVPTTTPMTTSTMTPTTNPTTTVTTTTMETTTSLETTSTTNGGLPDLITTTVGGTTTEEVDTTTPDIPPTLDPNDGASSLTFGHRCFILAIGMIHISFRLLNLF